MDGWTSYPAFPPRPLPLQLLHQIIIVSNYCIRWRTRDDFFASFSPYLLSLFQVFTSWGWMLFNCNCNCVVPSSTTHPPSTMYLQYLLTVPYNTEVQYSTLQYITLHYPKPTLIHSYPLVLSALELASSSSKCQRDCMAGASLTWLLAGFDVALYLL